MEQAKKGECVTLDLVKLSMCAGQGVNQSRTVIWLDRWKQSMKCSLRPMFCIYVRHICKHGTLPDVRVCLHI